MALTKENQFLFMDNTVHEQKRIECRECGDSSYSCIIVFIWVDETTYSNNSMHLYISVSLYISISLCVYMDVNIQVYVYINPLDDFNRTIAKEPDIFTRGIRAHIGEGEFCQKFRD